MFDPVTFIEARRDGRSHTAEELEAFVRGSLTGEVADYQIAAWLMATYLNGLSREELRTFTLALGRSGEMVSFPGSHRCVDKHSTGGVGDKVTLVVVPLAAACGVPVAKLSGRGLGFTGGTVDKLDAIPGFHTKLSLDHFVRQVETLGCAISGHSLDLAPAEGVFYALRDVTGTIPSLPLIASSIVSKKLAGGARRFVFDVKVGKGAFMATPEEGRALARLLVDLSRDLGAEALAFLTAMNFPLGRWVGNAAEVREAIAVLRGEGPDDTRELCEAIGGGMIFLGGKVPSLEEGRRQARQALRSGKAAERFASLVAAQGGDPRVVDSPETFLPLAPETEELVAPREGVLTGMDARQVGEGVRQLGGGRYHKGDGVDLGVAVEMLASPGDRVAQGQPLLRLYGRTPHRLAEVRAALESAVEIGTKEAPPLPRWELLD
ncbi:MAG TPA: thymidine phosphorylase [Synergistaceae bacterium]|jgi:pyrimidine-nucleoside phosphorylase|nr:thymidine phosphorylase [Synergistaceae bacterium]